MRERRAAEHSGQVGRPPREPATPSSLAPALLRWAAGHGVDAGVLAERGGLDPSDTERDDAAVTTAGLASMFSFVAESLAEPHVTLRLPQELRYRRYDAGSLAARVAATPRDVLLALERFAALVFPRLEAKTIATGEGVRFEARNAGAPRGLGAHVDEYVVAFALGLCRRGPHPIVPVRVWLQSSRPAGDLGPLVQAMGTEEIELGAAHTGFELSLADAAAALPALDPMLVAVAEQVASAALASVPRAGALASAVSARIEATLPAEVSAESIAASMKMSGRTLQRRLEDEGVRFSIVLDGVRERIAKQLLSSTSMPLGEVAYRVGFSDLATFSRAFKRWTGVPPGAFRRISGPSDAT